MRRQLVRNGVLVGLGAMLAIVVSVASAEDPAPATDEPAKLDRTFENDEATAPAVPSPDMETGVGGSGPVGAQRRAGPDAGMNPDGGTGGAGEAGAPNGMTTMEDESVDVPEGNDSEEDNRGLQAPPQPEPAAPPTDTGTEVRDPDDGPDVGAGAAGPRSAAPANHTNIRMYGPNGISGDFVPTAPEPATTTGTAPGTGGGGEAGRPEDAVPHTRIIVYGPNGSADAD